MSNLNDENLSLNPDYNLVLYGQGSQSQLTVEEAAGGGVLLVAQGGTGANNQAAARVNLGAAASGANSDITALTGLAAWTSFTPTISAGAGTFTTVTGFGHYTTLGKTVLVRITVEITTNNTASGYVIASLPVGPTPNDKRQFIPGKETQATGYLLGGTIVQNTSNLLIQLYDGTYPGADGRTLTMEGSYETA